MKAVSDSRPTRATAERCFRAMLHDSATLYCGAPPDGVTLRDVAGTCRVNCTVVLSWLKFVRPLQPQGGFPWGWLSDLRCARDRAARFDAIREAS